MEPKKLKYKELPGLSERQISEHHDVLYAGYVKKTNEIREHVKKAELDSANASFSEIRELKLELSFALNGSRLHEWYFENLGGNGVIPAGISQKIEDDFGSFEVWQKEFMALAMAARGWVVLAKNSDGKLENYLCDWHSHGGVWNSKPLLVLDVYEHAYFLDYGTNRKGYLEAFSQNIDWEVVQKRFFEN